MTNHQDIVTMPPAHNEPQRLSALTDILMDRSDDEELQALVARASRESGYPIALVSLILNETQFFRAHVGLPPELAITRATDRCSSFCQFVVSEQRPFYVTHAERDARVPQELVERYGIQAYFGVPLRVRGEVAGSLCVIDVRPRELTGEVRASLVALAANAERRLAELGSPHSLSQRLLQLATHPTLAELRNQLQRIVFLTEVLPAYLTDLRSCAALAVEAGRPSTERKLSDDEIVRALGALAHAQGSVDEGMQTVDRLLDSTARMRDAIRGLEAIIRPSAGEGCDPGEAIRLAGDLAHHATKIVGGFRCAPPASRHRVDVRRARAVSLIAASLNMIAGEVQRLEKRVGDSAIEGFVTESGGALELRLAYPGLEGESWSRIRTSLAVLAEDEPGILLEAMPDSLRFRMTWQPAPSDVIA